MQIQLMILQLFSKHQNQLKSEAELHPSLLDTLHLSFMCL